MPEKTSRILCYCLLAAFLFSLVPVFLLGAYNHPTGDDYYYGAQAHIVWENTQSVTAAIAEAARGTAEDYFRWQGTYSAMLLMRLQPTVFSEDLYAFVTPVLLIMLSGGIFWLLHPVFKSLLHAPSHLWLGCSSLLAGLCIQLVPTQGEAFFWYNGSMYYTGFFAVLLFYLGAALRFLLVPRRRYPPLLAVLGVFLAGGNYIVLLLLMILQALLCLFLLFQKRKKEFLAFALIFLLILAGLLVSALAPGNAVRQGPMWKTPAWKAILLSLIQGIRYLDAWLDRWWLAAAALMTPMMLKTLRRLSFRFPCPLPALGLLYCIFCAMSCPTFYTMHSTGPARAVAVVYYGFILLSFAGYFYLLGYLVQRIRPENAIPHGAIRTGWLLALGLLTAMPLVSGDIRSLTTLKAAYSLITGEAQAYRQEYEARLSILTDPAVTDAVLAPFESRPDMLYVGDLGGNPEDPANRRVADFYGKKSVIVSES